MKKSTAAKSTRSSATAVHSGSRNGNGNGNGAKKHSASQSDRMEHDIDSKTLLSILRAVKKGDFSVRMPENQSGAAGEIAVVLNEVIELNERMSKEFERVGRAVGRDGRINQRASMGAATGSWAICVDSVNGLITDLVQPTTEVARVIGAVAKGDLSQTMSLELEGQPIKGEFLRVANTVNKLVEQLSSFATEVTRVAREVGTEGKLGGQAKVKGVAGTWKDLTDNVNLMAANLTAQVRNIAEVTTAVANGDLSKKITVDVKGEILELKNTTNTMVDQLRSFAAEVTRVAREVGTEGKLGGQADVRGVTGAWKDLTDNVNMMAANLTAQVRNIAQVTTAVANGDFSRKITIDVKGEILELKNTINEMVGQLGSFASEVTRVAREVGTEGKLGGQAQVRGVTGAWRDLTDSVNLMGANLTAQVRNIAEVTTAVAKGDLSKKITVDVKGEILELKKTINTMVDQLGAFANEVTRVAREVGTEGKLGGQADVPGVTGAWKSLTDNVNLMASNLTGQVRNIADVTTAVANGDLSKKITVDVKGEILELKRTINTMVDQLSSFAAEVTRVAREVGTEGKLGGQADVKGVGGVWRGLTDNVNLMASNLTGQVRNIADVTTAVATGDLSKKVTVDVKGEILELKNTINTMVDQLATFAVEVTRVAREVGTEGKLGGQAEVKGVGGTWKDLTDSVNLMASNLTGQVRNLADVTTAVANGDLSKKMTVDVKGEILELKNTINTMVDQLRSFASEVTRVAREVGTEGKLGGQADVKGVGGTWKDLTDSVNLMASNLTAQVRNIAAVTTAVANGDLTKKITVDVKGEILELKNTTNTMVDQLRSFSSEVTRVAKEVGTDGKLGGQADVKDVGGVWKDLTDNVNIMANNLTSQVRGIARVVTAVATGDLKRKLMVDAKGEIAELADTINSMIDTLDIFADQVTSVAREVGVEGKLGGQAKVPGASGTWRALTDNVNQLAANLTAQVRAIADVATAVTQGELNRYITVQAEGEVAKLKDNINEMIRNLKETTQKNQEQDWLKTNIAKFTGMLQGHKDLVTVGKLILSELAPLVSAQHGVFYIADTDEKNEKLLKLLGSYAYRERKNISNTFRFGEGLVGECALEKERILVTNVPTDYVYVNSGLGEAPPANIIVLPVAFEGEIKAVIELASFNKFSEIHMQFLDMLTESIGIVLNTIAANMRTEALLMQSQSLTEELQKQQEELTDTNQRLKEQAATLKASEELLKDQQEVLRHTNEELEVKARLLAQQKSEVELKNHEVELGKVALEEKANQLALTSKYKSEFLANMSHELRTPLNSLLILSQLLGENSQGNLTAQQVEFSNTIHSAGTDLLALISDILDLSKIESGTMSIDMDEVELLELQSNMERSFRQVAIDKQLSFELELDNTVPRSIRTDSKRLQQILKNLLSNAFKFTHQGTVKLHISTALEGWNHNNQVLNQDRQVIAFAVTDTGIGVPIEKQKIIFEAFQQADGTTSRKYGGTGLGLSISREIATLLGGEIAVESIPGVGSTFILYLPHAAIARQKGSTSRFDRGIAEMKASLNSEANKKLLLIEDDRENILQGDRVLLIIDSDEVLMSSLVQTSRQSGLKVITAVRGELGLALARKYHPSLILLNTQQTDINGWSLLDRMKRDSTIAHIPVIAVGSADERRKALSAGALQFIESDCIKSELDGALKEAEAFRSKSKRKLLLVEHSDAQQYSITAMIGNSEVDVHSVRTAEEAINVLTKESVDCVLLDCELPDMSGTDLVNKIRTDLGMESLPIVAYAGEELSDQDAKQLQCSVQSIVPKDVGAPERLLSEAALYLHSTRLHMPAEQKRLIEGFRRRAPFLNGKKVLIVDDDSRNIMALKSLLERFRLEVLVAESGRHGIEVLQDHPDTELVFMDVMMPDLDGYETIQVIRSFNEFAKLPIIALTAKAMQGDRLKCLEAGASDYIAKPIDHDQLMSLFRVWLAPQRHMTEPSAGLQVEPINLELLTELYPTESLRPVLELFLHEATNLTNKLKFDLESNDTTDAAVIVRGLKSLASMMTASTLYTHVSHFDGISEWQEVQPQAWTIHEQILKTLGELTQRIHDHLTSQTAASDLEATGDF